jgi:23S rRNA-/tRNA-specific pseudouridylate synthase
MLFAKTAQSHKLLNDQFFNRKVKKTYTLLAHGLFAGDSGVIDKPIRQFGSGRMGVDEKTGKPSVTKYEVIDRKGEYSLVSVFPQTGRRHQIRVHFYSIDHPVAGDLRYGDKSKQQPFPRLMLHASKVEFALSSGERKVVASSLPESFAKVLTGLGWDGEEIKKCCS